MQQNTQQHLRDLVVSSAAAASLEQGADQHQQDGFDAVQFAVALPSALRVSSTHGDGIDDLKQAMLCMLDSTLS